MIKNVIFYQIQDVNKNEKIEIDRISNEYMRGDPSQRGIDIPVYKVKQGLEPPIFTGFFPSWDSNLWTKVINYFSQS